MRRSRSLSFKKEQEDKLKHLVHSKPDERKEEQKAPVKRAVEPPQRTTSSNAPSVVSKKEAPKKESVYSDDEEEEHSRYNEETNRYSDYEEEEELPKPQTKVAKKNEPVASPRKQTKQAKTEEVIVKKEEIETDRPSKKAVVQKRPATAGRKRTTQESREEQEEDVREEKEEREEDDRRKFIVPKTMLVKFVSNAEIETASGEIYPYLQQEMLDYIVEVIKIVSNDDTDDEVVIKDSNLRFLGDKSKSVGILDQKTFDRLYTEVRKNISHNVTFTAEAYKSLCKYTEIHTLDFLRKARSIMVHSGRKRLNLGDIELLNYILE